MTNVVKDEYITDYERGFERCVVTFIDILGYRHLLKTRRAEDIVKIVKNLREFTNSDYGSDEPPNDPDEFRLYTQAFSEAVSDAVVRVRTVDTQSKDGPFVYELIDLMHAILECVNQGIFIRGGMTIGPVHIGRDGEGPIFGNAMVRAYEIETNEAIYPRIMIDDAALVAYTSDKSLWQEGEFGQYEANLALPFLGISEDGSYFLDYLRAAGPGEFDDGVTGHFAFLQRHCSLIIENLKTTDAKVRRKFVWLANYHNRSIIDLQQQYDMSDSDGSFEQEIGISPAKLFSDLIIDVHYPDIIGTLNEIAKE